MLCETYLQKSPSYTVNPIKIIILSFNCEHKNFSVTLWPSIYLEVSLPLAPSDSAVFALQPKQIALQDFPFYNRRSIPITLSARPFDCLSVRYDRKSAEHLSRTTSRFNHCNDQHLNAISLVIIVGEEEELEGEGGPQASHHFALQPTHTHLQKNHCVFQN